MSRQDGGRNWEMGQQWLSDHSSLEGRFTRIRLSGNLSRPIKAPTDLAGDRKNSLWWSATTASKPVEALSALARDEP